MGALSTMSGRFCGRQWKTWDGFTDQDGKEVQAGRSLTFWLVTDHDEVVEMVRVDRERFDQIGPILDQLTFGVRVVCHVNVSRWGYRAHHVEREAERSNGDKATATASTSASK